MPTPPHHYNPGTKMINPTIRRNPTNNHQVAGKITTALQTVLSGTINRSGDYLTGMIAQILDRHWTQQVPALTWKSLGGGGWTAEGLSGFSFVVRAVAGEVQEPVKWSPVVMLEDQSYAVPHSNHCSYGLYSEATDAIQWCEEFHVRMRTPWCYSQTEIIAILEQLHTMDGLLSRCRQAIRATESLAPLDHFEVCCLRDIESSRKAIHTRLWLRQY